jgi:hypothetical protein
LKPGFHYQFKVRSVNSAGPSALSPASALILAATLPTAPRNLTLISRSTTSLKFKWEMPSDTGGVELLGYNVYVAKGNEAYVQVADAVSTADATKQQHDHPPLAHDGTISTPLTPGEIYRFKVSAHNVVGEGERAQLSTNQDLEGDVVDYVLAADLPEAPPNPPTANTITEVAVSLTLGALAAASNGGSTITGYLVEIDDGLGGPDGTASASGFRRVHDSMETSLIINNLIGGRTYNIRYAARNNVYDSGNMFGCDALKWSRPLRVLTAVAPATPENLRHATMTEASGRLMRFRTKLMVQWDPLMEAELGSSPLVSYTLSIRDVAAQQEAVQTVSAQASHHIFDGTNPVLPIISGKSYTIKMKATNLVGESAWSDPTAAIQPGVEPTRPGLYASGQSKAIIFTATTRTSITLSFSALTGQDTGGSAANPIATKYHVYYSTKETSDYQLLVTTETATPQVAEYLSPGRVYFFKFRAENAIGLLSEFSTVYWMMAGTVPSAPAGAPKLVSQGPESITVQVVPPSDTGGPQVTRYEIEITKMEGSTAAAPITLEQDTDVTDMDIFTFDAAKGLAPGFEYIIRARAHNFITDYSISNWSE